MEKITIDDVLENLNALYEEEKKEEKKEEKEEKKDDKEDDKDKDVGGGVDKDDEEDAEKSEKELIDYFTEQGSDDPEADAVEYLKNLYGDPDDPEFQKELKEIEKEEKEEKEDGDDKKEKKESKNESLVSETQMITEASILGRMLTGSLIRSSIRAHLAKNRMTALKIKIEHTTDPKEKKKLEGSYDMISKSNFDSKGRPRAIVFNCRQTLAGIKGVVTGKAKLGEALKNCTTLGKLVGAAQCNATRKDYPDEWGKAKHAVENETGTKAYKKSEGAEKDADGNILKHEEVVDKETGQKIKVITHTGPRGGKFYYPDGVPKDAAHRVYVESATTLTNYLKESLGI